jgi:acetyltransferase
MLQCFCVFFVAKAVVMTQNQPGYSERNFTTRSGEQLKLRAIRPDDMEALQTFHHSLSPNTVYFRFHAFKRDLSRRTAEILCGVDGKSAAAIVAVNPELEAAGSLEKIVGVVRYGQTGEGRADWAIVLRDAWQGQGLGHVLLEELFAVARRNGFVHLEAEILTENQPMLKLLNKLPYRHTSHVSAGVLYAVVELDEVKE